MLFKLSVKNMKKSFGDYTIYFLTLILGVAIFYVFNSMDSQQAMMQLSASTKAIVDLLLQMLGGVSVFVSIILGFLIVYANNFLIKRRKKEFGIYMTLGMGKGQISRILFLETIIVGIMSLAVGLLIGVFASQGMSVVVAKMFEADMSRYEFVFSKAACIKTIVYFGIMYLAVILMNMISISKLNLIDLLTAVKKSESIKVKNAAVSVIVFLASIGMLAYAYYNVAYKTSSIGPGSMMLMIAIGSLGTFLFFWSLAGFLLKLVQTSRKTYFKGLNMFIMRQINSKINTMVFSMTIICLMLFMTIGVLSSGMSLNTSVKEGLKENAPVDVNLWIPVREDGKTAADMIEEAGYSMDHFKPDYVLVTEYATNELTLKDTLGAAVKEMEAAYTMLDDSTAESVMKVSEYNKIADMYGQPKIEVGQNEYAVVCNYDNMRVWRDKGLEQGTKISLGGVEYSPHYDKCQDGFIKMSGNATNFGIIVLPDEAVNEAWSVKSLLIANYSADDQQGKESMEAELAALDSPAAAEIDAVTKISLYEGSVGLGAIVTFIAIYLGVIFLISSAAILALKELSDSSDNRERYAVLRQIGTDEKMINRALFTQTAIFFLIPLALAAVHSIFGIKFVNVILESMGAESRGESIVGTAIFIIAIYGGYFIATYFGSKRIIAGK